MEFEQGLEIVKNEVKSISELGTIKVNSRPTLDASIEGMERIKKVGKNIKAVKDQIIAPAKEIINRTKEFWQPFEDSLEAVEIHIKTEQKKYLDKVEAEKAKAEEKINSEMQNGDISEQEIENAGKKLERIENKSDGIKTYTYEEVVIIDKSLIPLNFLEPNITAIKQAWKLGAVPGTELRKEERIKK